jgi:hypothetical protein
MTQLWLLFADWAGCCLVVANLVAPFCCGGLVVLRMCVCVHGLSSAGGTNDIKNGRLSLCSAVIDALFFAFVVVVAAVAVVFPWLAGETSRPRHTLLRLSSLEMD